MKCRRCLALATLVLLVGGLAVADETKKGDPQGDTRGLPMQSPFDFRSAWVRHEGTGHGAGDIMIHKVVSWKRAGYRSVVLDLKTGGDDFYATVRKRPGKRAGIYNYYSGEYIGPARYKKITDRSFSFTFSMEEFGLPDRYAWRWRTLAKGSTDVRPRAYDKVPNRGVVRHVLSHGG